VSNSLTDLNNFSNQPIIFLDNRPYQIEFDPDPVANVNIAVDEDIAFLSPVGTDIVKCISPPDNITYNIDLSTVGNVVSFEWPIQLPPALSILNPQGNVYSITGIFTPESWNAVKNPLVTIKDAQGNITYTANIEYPDPEDIFNVAVKSWQVNANVIASDELTEPLPWVYVKNNTGTVDGVPVIVDPYEGPETYTMVITPSTTIAISTISTNGFGGTSQFDVNTKVVTIVGTKQQVNSHLTSMLFTPVNNVIQGFDFEYFLTNPISGLQTTRIQSVTAADVAFNINRTTYLEDTPISLDFTVVDQSATATSYTIQISQSEPPSNVRPGIFSLDGANVGNTVTWTGTRQEVNSADVVFFPPIDWDENIVFSVSQSKVDDGNVIVQHTNTPWILLNAGTNPEISNLTSRAYLINNVNENAFGSASGLGGILPVINDGPDIGQTYTITLTSPVGKFSKSESDVPETYTVTGSMQQINESFVGLKFFPNPGVSAGQSFYNYVQVRDGFEQLNTDQTITLSEASFQSPVTYTFNTTSPTTSRSFQFTPTFAELNYANIDVLVVGGGGGAGYVTLGDSGGGGGGGQVRILNFPAGTFPSGTSNIVVGGGGVGGVNQTGATGNATTCTSSANVVWSSCAGGGGGSAAVYSNGSPGGNSVKFIAPSTNQTTVGGAGRNLYFDSGGTARGPHGGGGASSSGNGGNAPLLAGGNGSNGLISDITGASLYYGGGGAGRKGGPGSINGTPGLGGTNPVGINFGNGTLGRGGGGSPDQIGGNGGSGTVIIRIS
jgi:hypothetical protein